MRVSALAVICWGSMLALSISNCDETPSTKSPANGDRVLMIGDSLSAGWSTRVQGDGFAFRMSDALRTRGIKVVHQIHTGMPARDYFSEFSVPPDIDGAIVELGTNDARKGSTIEDFSRDYDELIGAASLRGISSLVCVGIFDPQSSTQDLFDSVIEDTCLRYGGTFVSIADVFERNDSRGPAWKPSWKGNADLGHPNDLGHAIIFMRLSSRIGLVD